MQNRIGILRRERGWSLTDLARAAGTTKAQIQKLERGERRLSLPWMQRLAQALEVKASDLLPSDAVTCQHGPEERKILEIVSQLPAEDRLVLVRIAADLLDTLRRERGRHGLPGLDHSGLDQPGLDQPSLDQPGLDQPSLDQQSLDQQSLADELLSAASGLPVPLPRRRRQA